MDDLFGPLKLGTFVIAEGFAQLFDP